MIMTAFKYEMIVISILFPMSNIIEHIWDCTHYTYCSWWLPWLFWLAVQMMAMGFTSLFVWRYESKVVVPGEVREHESLALSLEDS